MDLGLVVLKRRGFGVGELSRVNYTHQRVVIALKSKVSVGRKRVGIMESI